MELSIIAIGVVSDYFLGWNVAAIVCLVVGLVLMIIEMFTPGLGVPGALGGAALIAAIVLRADSLANALITLAIILVLLSIAAFVIFRSLNKGALAKSPIVLNDAINAESSSLSEDGMRDLIGREGVCLNTLRPSGNANFDGTKLDVVSSGEFIQRGRRVRIIGVEGIRIMVEEIGDGVL